MATQKQLAALRKARAARKRKAKGLGAILSLPSKTTTMNVMKDAGYMILGFLIGREGSAQIVKMKPELFASQWGKYLPSILQVGGGLLVQNMQTGAVKKIGQGMLASGALDLIQQVSGKDFLNDGLLSGLPSLGKAPYVDLPTLESTVGDEDVIVDYME